MIQHKISGMKLLIFSALLISVAACTTQTTTTTEELDLKKQALDLKEQELKMRADSLANVSMGVQDSLSIQGTVAKSPQNLEALLGYWVKPKADSIHIKFYRDGFFTMSDYNKEKRKIELLSGKYSLEGGTLVLLYNDRPKQSFSFTQGSGNDKNFYIRNSDNFFIKSTEP